MTGVAINIDLLVVLYGTSKSVNKYW